MTLAAAGALVETIVGVELVDRLLCTSDDFEVEEVRDRIVEFWLVADAAELTRFDDWPARRPS